MATTRPQPWHRVVRLKDELRSGELTLAEFAADLHEVTLGRGTRPIYEDPARFFALTFATHALRELVKDVAERTRRQEHQGGTATGADLRRRQDPYPHRALPPLPQPGRAVGHQGCAGIPAARRCGVAGGVSGIALLRQDRRGARNRRHPRTGRRDAHAEASVERARVPACRSRRVARAACRRRGRGTRDAPCRARCWSTCLRSSEAGTRHPDSRGRSADVCAGQGGNGPGLARANRGLLPASRAGRHQGGSGGHGGLPARFGSEQVRRSGPRSASRPVRCGSAAEGGRCPARRTGGCRSGAAPQTLRCGQPARYRDAGRARHRCGGRPGTPGPRHEEEPASGGRTASAGAIRSTRTSATCSTAAGRS